MGYWAEFKTGIRGFKPWLEAAEKRATGGLSKPQTLDEANAMFAQVSEFDQNALKHLKILENAETAANKMTTHKEADDEVAALKARYAKVKGVSDEWMKKADTLVKEWKLLDNTVNELNSWVAQDRGAEQEQNFSLEKMEIIGRTQKHLQGEGEACRQPVKTLFYFLCLHVTIASYYLLTYFITNSWNCDSRDLTFFEAEKSK